MREGELVVFLPHRFSPKLELPSLLLASSSFLTFPAEANPSRESSSPSSLVDRNVRDLLDSNSMRSTIRPPRLTPAPFLPSHVSQGKFSSTPTPEAQRTTTALYISRANLRQTSTRILPVSSPPALLLPITALRPASRRSEALEDGRGTACSSSDSRSRDRMGRRSVSRKQPIM